MRVEPEEGFFALPLNIDPIKNTNVNVLATNRSVRVVPPCTTLLIAAMSTAPMALAANSTREFIAMCLG